MLSTIIILGVIAATLALPSRAPEDAIVSEESPPAAPASVPVHRADPIDDDLVVPEHEADVLAESGKVEEADGGGAEKEAGGEKKKEEHLTKESRLSNRVLWSFLALVTVLILGTVAFEESKQALHRAVMGSPMLPLMNSLFSELTTLGFLGIATFVITKSDVLQDISKKMFPDDEEGSTVLIEMLEQIHLMIFLVMVIFLMKAVSMVVAMTVSKAHFVQLESSIITFHGRLQAVQELEELREVPYWPGELTLRITPRAKLYHHAEERVRYMLLRNGFIHFNDNQAGEAVLEGGDQESAESKHLVKQFPFQLYLSKVIGHRLADVVEITFRQWLILLSCIAAFTGAALAADGSWEFMLWLWISATWSILIVMVWFRHKLRDQLEELIPADYGHSMIKSAEIVRNRAVTDTPQPQEKGALKDSGFEVQQIMDTLPKYRSTKSEEPRALSEWLIGEPARTPGQQQMFNIMLFGRNEVTFHVILMRFMFLINSVFVSVYALTFHLGYVSQVYSTEEALAIGALALAPPIISWGGYLYEVVLLSTMITSVEHMRVRQVVNEVYRHQKEANAVSLMRLIAVILDPAYHSPIEPEEVVTMAQALDLDREAKRTGDSATAVSTYIAEYLEDQSAELFMAKMLDIFESFDDDNSGVLTKAELFAVFKQLGFDSPDDLDQALGPITSKLDLHGVDSSTLGIDPGAASHGSASTGSCWPTKTTEEASLRTTEGGNHPSAGGLQKGESMVFPKPVFLAMYMHLEKMARSLSCEDVAETWFHKIDDDGSGRLSVVELQEVLQACGKAFSPNDVSALILELDENGDGEFDIEEFTAWFRKHER